MRQREVIRSYDDLILALQRCRERRGISCAELEHVTGLQSGYVTKIENAFSKNKKKTTRFMGPLSFGLILQGLGVGIALIDNANVPLSARSHRSDAQKAKAHKRWENADMNEAKRNARKAGRTRVKLMSPEARSQSAKHAANARWAGKQAAEKARLEKIATAAGKVMASSTLAVCALEL